MVAITQVPVITLRHLGVNSIKTIIEIRIGDPTKNTKTATITNFKAGIRGMIMRANIDKIMKTTQVNIIIPMDNLKTFGIQEAGKIIPRSNSLQKVCVTIIENIHSILKNSEFIVPLN